MLFLINQSITNTYNEIYYPIEWLNEKHIISPKTEVFYLFIKYVHMYIHPLRLHIFFIRTKNITKGHQFTIKAWLKHVQYTQYPPSCTPTTIHKTLMHSNEHPSTFFTPHTHYIIKILFISLSKTEVNSFKKENFLKIFPSSHVCRNMRIEVIQYS